MTFLNSSYKFHHSCVFLRVIHREVVIATKGGGVRGWSHQRRRTADNSRTDLRVERIKVKHHLAWAGVRSNGGEEKSQLVLEPLTLTTYVLIITTALNETKGM